MALHIGDELEGLLGESFSCPRHETWLWHYLDNPVGRLQTGAFGPGARDCMANYLKSNPDLVGEVIASFGLAILPVQHLDWISSDDRQNDFVFNYLRMVSLFNWSNLHPTLSGRRRTIALIDACPADFAFKIQELEGAKNAWARNIEFDRLFDWFRVKDEVARCDFFWNWLMRNKPNVTKNKIPFASYQNVMLFFDKAGILNSEKTDIVGKVKKAWSQSQYRKNLDGKKQCNLVLQEKSIKLLDRMARKYDLSRAEIVEILIQDESTQGSYISARLQRHKNLLRADTDAEPIRPGGGSPF